MVFWWISRICVLVVLGGADVRKRRGMTPYERSPIMGLVGVGVGVVVDAMFWCLRVICKSFADGDVFVVSRVGSFCCWQVIYACVGLLMEGGDVKMLRC